MADENKQSDPSSSCQSPSIVEPKLVANTSDKSPENYSNSPSLSELSFWSLHEGNRERLKGGAGANKKILSKWRKDSEDKKNNEDGKSQEGSDDGSNDSSDSSIELVHIKKYKKTRSSSSKNKRPKKSKSQDGGNDHSSPEIKPDPKHAKNLKKTNAKKDDKSTKKYDDKPSTAKTNKKRKRYENSESEKSDDSIAETTSVLMISQPGYTEPPPCQSDTSNPNPSSGSRKKKSNLVDHKHNHEDVDPLHWKQFLFWNVPFINLLESASHQQISLQEFLQNTIPLKERRILESQARTAKYTALDDALGNTLQQLGEGMGFPVEQTGSRSRDRVLFKNAKHKIADKYNSAYRNIMAVSEMLGSAASIFWSFPPIYLIPLIAMIGNILGDRSRDEYHEYITDLFDDIIRDHFLYPNECIDNFMEFFNEESLESDFRFGYQHVVRLLSSHRRTRAGCQETPSKAATVDGENTMQRAYRLASDGNHRRYVTNARNLNGFQFPLTEETNHLLETPISSLGYLILRSFKQIMANDIFEQLRDKFVAMTSELDTCLQIAIFTNLETNGSENNMGNVYGFSTENTHHLRPWENMFQHNSFVKQVRSVTRGLRHIYDTPAQRDERDVNNLSDQEIFELFIDDFIFCSLTAEKPIFRETSMFKFSILHLPFRAYLRNPHLMYEKEPGKTSKTTGRKKSKK